MNERPSLLRQAVAGIASAAFSLVLWTIWLALVLLLAVQIYIASTNELTVPGFVLQRLEQRLAASGVRAQFASTSLDPTGSLLAENVRLSLPNFPDPIITARAVYVRLNPWMLSVGRVEPREIRITGATFTVPAMLTPSGAPEQLVHSLDATLRLGDRELVVEQFSTRIARAAITVHGTIPLARTRGTVDPRRISELIERRFPGLCRQAVALAQQLERFERPALALELEASDARAPVAKVRFLSDRFKLGQPIAAEIEQLEVATRVLLLDQPTISRVDFTARELQLPGSVVVRGIRATAFGRLHPPPDRLELRAIEFTAAAADAFGFASEAISALFLPRPLPRAEAAISAQLMGEPITIRADADFAARSALVRLNGTVAPEILRPLSERLGVEVRKYFDFAALQVSESEIRLGGDWKFETARARVAFDDIKARGVRIDSGRATVHFDGRQLYSPEVFARIGPNSARGSYVQDLRTRDFRFLLHGRLRPLDIKPWFRTWWEDFFQRLEFPSGPPLASVDVTGVWREGRETAVFVFADAANTLVRGVPFDQVRARLFIRPSFFDGLELLARHGDGSVRGPFTFRTHPGTREWSLLEFNVDSTFELGRIAQVMQPLGAGFFSAFQLAKPPELRVRGRFDGPGAPEGQHQRMQIEAKTAGAFRFHHFPLQDVSFNAAVEDDVIVIDRLDARFGGGAATAHARISGPGGRQRLGFDLNLKNASLGELAADLEEFFALEQGRAPSAPGKYVQQKANLRLDLAASAEGRYADPFSFTGDGHATLQGAEIGEVPLLGALSELFTFTALRFTSARANFNIAGNKLVFPAVALRGDNSAMDAHGEYYLDRHELDFNVRVFPFQESGNLIKSVVGAVLTPLSNALEVKLTGTLQKPQWVFVLGPTNFLRGLAPDAGGAERPKVSTPPQPGAPTAPPPSQPAAPAAPAQQPP